jgi:patatin-like phospholipase/acyl hydrolase
MGAFPAAFLAAYEEDLGRPIGQYFDLVAGTSTGGILAIGLALGIPAKTLLQLYEERGPEIFGQQPGQGRARGLWRAARHLFAPKHDANVLRSVLSEVLGDRRLGEAGTRLLVPAWEADRQRVYIFKTAHHARLKSDYRRLALDAALGTAAAPTYFKRHRTEDGVGLVDGGIWANNPVALAVVEAITLLGWRPQTLQVLSLGCVNEIYALAEAPGVGGVLMDLARLFMDGQSHGALGMAKLLTGHEYERTALHRVCPDVPKNLFRLDDTTKIERLKGLGASSAREHRPRLEPVFFGAPAAPFLPVYSLSGSTP